MDLASIRALVDNDMLAVDEVILRRLASDVVLINQVGQHIVRSGGKRLRPMVVLLAARACGDEVPHRHELAAIIEFIHTATLLHDDVVDGSELRRGNETANAIWGNAASVLVGDFLYSRSFEMMVDVQNMQVMEILAHATNRIAEGEVLQLLNCHDPETTEERYLDVIERKTARLFEAGARLGAVLAGADAQREQSLAEYGLRLGIAFQLIDDVLDYSASSAELGKNVGDDLAEGKPTLPLIRALQQSAPPQAELIRNAIRGEGEDAADIGGILEAIESTDAIPYTREFAERESSRAIEALASLEDSPFRDALLGLAKFAVNRSH